MLEAPLRACALIEQSMTDDSSFIVLDAHQRHCARAVNPKLADMWRDVLHSTVCVAYAASRDDSVVLEALLRPSSGRVERLAWELRPKWC